MKQIVAVHDLSGFGRCSLTVVLPVLAALGVRALPLPTAVLSAHTAFPATGREVFVDLTGQMEPTLDHWNALGVRLDGFYSGFLGAPEQMDILARRLPEMRSEGFLALVDPVMGDHGRTYRTYTPEMCRKMAEFAKNADIITPNLTEAAILLGEEYDSSLGGCVSFPGEYGGTSGACGERNGKVGRESDGGAEQERKARSWVERLSLDGRRSVILTGVSLRPGQLGAVCLDRDTGEVHFGQAPLAGGRFSGTGDLFAAVAFGRLLQGRSLREATDCAVEFVSRAARATLDRGGAPVEGADLEPLLGLLT